MCERASVGERMEQSRPEQPRERPSRDIIALRSPAAQENDAPPERTPQCLTQREESQILIFVVAHARAPALYITGLDGIIAGRFVNFQVVLPTPYRRRRESEGDQLGKMT